MNGLLKHLFTGLLLLCFIQLLAQPTFTITPANNLVNQGNTFTVDVQVSNFANVSSMQFPITWNDAIISYQSISNINSTALSGLTVSSFGLPGNGNAPDDQVILSWNHPTSQGVTLADQTVLFSLTFQGEVGGTTLLEFNPNLPQSIEILDPVGNDLGFAGNNSMVTVNGGGMPTGFTLSLPDINASQNDNVCLPVTVNDFDNILGMQFSMNYDASALTYTGAQNFNATLLGWTIGSVGQPMPAGPLAPGNLTFTWNDPLAAGVSLTDGETLVELCFDVVTTTSTTVTFSGTPTPIEIINSDEMTVPFNSQSGTVTVGGGSIDGFTLIMADATAMTGDNVCLPVTVNDFDNILGLQFSMNYNASALTYTGAQNFNSDLLGWTIGSVGQPMPEGPLAPGNITFTWNDPLAAGVSLPDGATLVEICFDVVGSTTSTITFSGNPTPIEVINSDEMTVPFNSDPGVVTIGTGGTPPVTLTLADVTTMQGSNVCLPLTVTNFTDIQSMQFTVNYNSSILAYTGAQSFNGSLPGWGAGNIANSSPGVLTVNWSNGSGVSLANGTSLVELCFDVNGNTTSDVTISSPSLMNGDGAVTTNTNSGTVTIQAPIEGFTLIMADVTAMTGDNVCLPITVNDFDNILGLQFSVNYDAAALMYTGAQNFNSDLLGWTIGSVGQPMPEGPLAPGNITFTWNDPLAAGVSLPNGATLVEICFDVIGASTTTVTFSGMPTPIEVIDGNEMEVDFNSDPGVVTIGTVGAPPVTLTLADVTTMQGSNVCLPLTVTNFTDIQSMQFTVNYNSSILGYTGAQSFNGSLPGWSAGNIANSSPGVLTVNWSNGSGVSLANGTSLVELCFDVNGNTTSDVTISSPSLMNGDGAVTTNTNSGTVTIQAPIEGFTLIMADVTAMTGDNVCLPITVNDFDNILGLQFSVNYDAAALMYTGAQNFNSDLLGWTIGSVGQPMPEGPLAPGNITFTWNDPLAAGVSLPNGATLVEICFDVVGASTTTVTFSGMPTPIEVIDGNEMEVDFNSDPGVVTIGTVGAPPVTLTLADVTTMQGSNVCLPLTVTNFTDIQSMQFTVNYNSSILGYTGAQSFNGSLPGWGAGNIVNSSPGVLTVNWSNGSGVSLANGTSLVELCFDVNGNTTSDVTISSPSLMNGDGAVTTNTNSGTVTIQAPIEGFTLIMADVTAMTGDNVCLPITVNDFDNILGLQFSVNYDAAALTYTGAQNFNSDLLGWTIGSVGQPMPEGPLAPGNITFTWNDPLAAGVSLPNGATLVEICFDVVGASTTTVTFSGMPTPIEVIDGNEMEVDFNSDPGVVTIGTVGAPPVTLTLADVTTMQGSNVCLPLTVTNFTDIQSMQFTVNYNSSILGYTGAQSFNGSLPGWGAGNIVNSSPGVLTVNWSNGSGVSLANGTSLVELCFDVNGNTTSDVTISTPSLMNGDGAVTTNTNSGTVTVQMPFDGFTLIMADATVMTGDNVCLPITVNDFTNILGMQFSVNYDAAALTYTGVQNFNGGLLGWGIGSVGQPMPAGPLAPGNITFTWNDPLAAGVDLPDGDVLVEICFDVVTTTTTTVTFSGMPTPIEIIDGNEMEVEFNSDPGVVTIGTVGAPPVTLTLADVTTMQGSNVCLPLTVTNFTDIQSMQFTVNYNSSILGYTGAQSFNGSLPGWGAGNIVNSSPGVLTVNWSNGSGVSLVNGTSLVELCFDVNGNTTSDVTISSPSLMNGDGAVTTNTNSGTVTVQMPFDGFTLIMADATVMTGDNVCLPITVNDFTNILGMQFSVNYDAAALTYTGVQNFNGGLLGWGIGSVGQPMPAGPLAPGNITFTWNDPLAAGVDLPDGDVLVEICFDVVTTTTTTVTFSGMPTPIEIIDGNEMEVEFNSDPGVITIGTAEPGEFAVTFPSVEACSGENFCLDLTATAFTNIQGMQFSITFNTADLAFTQITNINPALPGLTIGSFNTSMSGSGTLIFQWDSTSGTGVDLPPNAVLYSICFNKVSDNNTNVTIGGTPTPIEITDENETVIPFSGITGQVTCDPVPPLQFGQIDIVNLVCADDPTGSITIVSMVNGSGNYSYQWSVAGETGSSITGLEAGSYSVTVTDNVTGMMVNTTLPVSSPPALTGSVEDITNILCAGDSTGSITISAGGGVDPLSYDWSGDLEDNVLVQNNLPAGSYSVTIIDGNDCTLALENIQINELAAPIVLSGNVTLIPGNGNPGGIDLTVQGGNGGYMYSWTGPNSYTFTGEDPNNITDVGEYCVTVTDSFGCTESICFDVYEVLRLEFFLIDDACQGESNGGVDVTIAGGTCPAMNMYSWVNLNNPGVVIANTQDLVNQSAGTYRLTVTDCDGNSISVDITIGENDPIVIEAEVEAATNGNDGRITLTNVSGGSGSGYTFDWTGPGTFSAETQNISNLIFGTYTVVVTDGDGCTGTATYVVDAPPLVLNQLIATEVPCWYDETGGTVFFSVGGGAAPIFLSIDGPGGTQTGLQFTMGTRLVENLQPGEYTYTITDSGSGLLTGMFTIGVPDPITVVPTVVNDTEDAGPSGNISVLASGGTGALNINWFGGFPMGPTVIGITGPTVVNGRVTDTRGCVLDLSYEVLQLTEDVTITNAGCDDSEDGAITVTAAGGTEPFTYSWTAASTGSGVIISTEATVTGLSPDTYTVVIRDASGATLIRNYTITTQSDYTVMADVIEQPSCFDSTNGAILASVDNNGASTSFTYEFEFNGSVIGTNMTGLIENLGAGDYTILVTDNFGCTSSTITSLAAPSPVELPSEEDAVKPISCGDREDAEINAFASGGTAPYNYSWSVAGATGAQLTGLAPGTYSVTATDSNGCSATAEYDITAAMPLIVTIETTPHTDADECNGTATAIVLGGTPPYTYEWLNIPGTPDESVVDGLCAGTYMLQVTDSRGCTSSVVMGVVNDERFECFEERVVITPDGNGSNDEFIIFCAEALTDNHLEIYNRWGQLVFMTDNYDNTWEGTSQNGDELPAGPYYWVLDYFSTTGEPLQRRGSLTIVRDN